MLRRSFQRRDDLVDTGEAIRRLARETAENRRFPARVEVGHVDARRRRRFLQPFDGRSHRRVRHKRPDAGDQLVQHHAKRIHVGGGRHRAAFDLLGRHVSRRAGDRRRTSVKDSEKPGARREHSAVPARNP